MLPATVGSITHCLIGLKAGDTTSVQILWDRYFKDMVRLACKHLGESPRAAADEEDVALSAFQSFYNGARHNHFPTLDNRDDMWRLLATITARKVLDQIRSQYRQKRGGTQVRADTAAGLESATDPGLTPDVALSIADELHRLFDSLANDSLRQVALMRMEGYTGEEIAERLTCNRRTVSRKLELIRETWLGLDGP